MKLYWLNKSFINSTNKEISSFWLVSPKKIGTGSKGYVYHPSLDTDDDTIITKITNKKVAEIEINISKLIRNIDPTEKYFIYLKSAKKITKETIKQYPLIFKESQFKGKLNDLYMLNYHYGGISLAEFLYTEQPSLETMLLLSINILKGLILLSQNGICHHDINLSNILYDPSNSGHELRLIDFDKSKNNSCIFDIKDFIGIIRFQFLTRLNSNNIELKRDFMEWTMKQILLPPHIENINNWIIYNEYVEILKKYSIIN